jgi:hypothetical protein
MLDVFRFAWFAVRTFFGIGLLILAVETSMWMLVKVHSMATGSLESEAALRRVNSYHASEISHKDRPAAPVSSGSPSRPDASTGSEP